MDTRNLLRSWVPRAVCGFLLAGLMVSNGMAQNYVRDALWEYAYKRDSLNTIHRDSTLRWSTYRVDAADTSLKRTLTEFAWDYRKTAAAGGDTLILADSLGNPLFSFTTAGLFTAVGGTAGDSVMIRGWKLKNIHAGASDTLVIMDSTRTVYKLTGTNVGSSVPEATKLEINGTAGSGSKFNGSAYLKLKAAANAYPTVQFMELDADKWEIYNDPTNDTLVFNSAAGKSIKMSQDGRLFVDTLFTHAIGGSSPIEFLRNIADTMIFSQHRASATNGWNRGGMTIGPITMHYLGGKVGFADSSLIITSSVDDSVGAMFGFTDDGQFWILGRGRDGGTGILGDGAHRSAGLILMTPRRGTSKPNGTEASAIHFRHYDLETGGITGITAGSQDDWTITNTLAANGDTSLDIQSGGRNGFVTAPQLAVISETEGDTARLILAADQADDALDSVRIAVPNNGPMLLQAKGSASGFKTQAVISNTAGFTVDSLSYTLADSGQITPVDFSQWTADPDFWSSMDDSLEVTVAWDTVGSSAMYLQTMTAQPADTAARLQRIDVWSPILTVPPGFVGVDTVYLWSTDNIAMTGSWSDTVASDLFVYRDRGSFDLTGAGAGYARTQLATFQLDQASWASTNRGVAAFTLTNLAGLTRYSRFQFRWQAQAWYRGHSPAIGGMVIKWKKQ